MHLKLRIPQFINSSFGPHNLAEIRMHCAGMFDEEAPKGPCALGLCLHLHEVIILHLLRLDLEYGPPSMMLCFEERVPHV